MTYWFTSDPHFGHKNIIEYCERPFESVGEMNSNLILFWELMRFGDYLYVLGDVGLSKKWVMWALDKVPKGVQVHYVFGNHDYRYEKHISKHNSVVWSGDLKRLNINGQRMMLCHNAMRTWTGHWQLYGHSHGNLDPWDGQLDVGVDNAFKLVGEYRPLTLKEISSFITEKTDIKRYGKSPCWVGGNHHDKR